MKRRIANILIVTIAGASAWTAGCGDDTAAVTPPDDPSRPSSVTLSPATTELAALGDTVRLTAEVSDQRGSAMQGQTVAWASGDPLVATVNSTGLVTAAGNGAVTITATAGSASGTAMVAVTQMARAVAIAPANADLASGDTLRLVAEATDANGHALGEAGFTWTSTDESVATVDPSGLVRGVGEGVATILAAAGGIEAAAQIRVVSRDHPALAAFYEATGGGGWIENEGWLSDRPLGEWHGVTTGPDGRVTALRLGASDLAGPIPPEIGELSDLEILSLARNRLTGPIPPELGDLDRLKVLHLGVNRLTGRIPAELGNLASLETLRLRRNALEGPIPPELGAHLPV